MWVVRGSVGPGVTSLVAYDIALYHYHDLGHCEASSTAFVSPWHVKMKMSLHQ